MSKESDNYVSVWFWLFSFLVLLIPGVNVIMIFVWALAGDNQSRKNYFRAMILFWVLLLGLAFAVGFGLGLFPAILHQLQNLKPPYAK